MFLLAAVFPLELAAVLVAVLTRDTPSLTALGILSGSWLALGVQFVTGEPGSTSSTVWAE